VRQVIDYATLRGIRVIPEFDTPGHSLSWGQAFPQLLTTCQHDHQVLYGAMNPVRESTYKFLDKFLGEISHVFDDDFIHVGGDEVDLTCW